MILFDICLSVPYIGQVENRGLGRLKLSQS